MATLTTVIHVLACVFLILVVLIQSGKGAEISASLGGSSQTVFGSSGGANFFTRLTSILAATFFITSIVLTIMGSREQRSVFETTPVTQAPASTTPAVPAPSAAAPTSAPASAPGTPAAPASH